MSKRKYGLFFLLITNKGYEKTMKVGLLIILYNVYIIYESNYFVICKYFLVDPATSSDCYKSELTSVLAVIYSCS